MAETTCHDERSTKPVDPSFGDDLCTRGAEPTQILGRLDQNSYAGVAVLLRSWNEPNCDYHRQGSQSGAIHGARDSLYKLSPSQGNSIINCITIHFTFGGGLVNSSSSIHQSDYTLHSFCHLPEVPIICYSSGASRTYYFCRICRNIARA